MTLASVCFVARRPVAIALAAALIIACGTSPASAQAPLDGSSKLDPVLRLRARQLSGRSRVIVQFKDVADVRVITSARGQAGRFLRDHRANVAELDNLSLLAVAADPRVARVMIDRPAFPTMERTGAAIGATFARTRFDVTGKGIGVAVIDSGIAASHPDLSRSRGSSSVVHFKDFTNDLDARLWTSSVPYDDYGHGTHVAGIIAGSGYLSDGARAGVAPGARLIGLKVIDGDGHGYISDVIAALDYAVANKDAYRIRVINLSVASGVFESYNVDPLAQAARRAVDAGIVVVAAAGNLGRNEEGETQFGGITSPGNAPWVLTVGASSHQGTARRTDDTIGDFSSRGPTWIDFSAKPDLVAPGVGIESLADPQGSLYWSLSDYLLDGTRLLRYRPYLSLSGTSMAAPVVSGTVALMLEANPELTPNAVKALLQYTAQVRPNQHLLAQGAGLLNARGAIRLARFFNDPEGSLGKKSDVIEGESVKWAKHLIWGNYRITGGVPLPGSNAWTPGLTWGALKTPSGRPVVWGARDEDNIVWTTNYDDNIVWTTGGDDNVIWSSAGSDDNIVWTTDGDDNIVWTTSSDDNIVWTTATVQNVVWGTDCGGRNCRRAPWGARIRGLVLGTADADDNIVWTTNGYDNIVWTTDGEDNIVWTTSEDDNIVWTTSDDDNIVWTTGVADQVLWPAPNASSNRRATEN